MNKFLKFIIAGFINTIFGFSIYSFLIFLNTDYKLSIFISTVAGIFFNFFSYRKVFDKKFIFKFNNFIFIKFLITYSIIYFLNIYLLESIILFLDNNFYLAQIFSLIPCIIVNWLLLNLFVFRHYEKKIN